MDEKKDGYKKIKGIGWIPEEWEVSSVGESCNIKNNLRKPISELERRKIQGKYPYYGPTKILDYINECEIEGKNVLIGEDGDHFLKYRDQSMTLLVEGMYNVNNHAHILHGTDKCLTEWIFHFFRHRSLFSNLTRQGAGRYKLTKDALSKLSIVLPSIAEQEKISKILSTWDDAINKTKASIEEKKIIKKGLMQQLLTGNKRLKEFGVEDWKEVKLKKVLKKRNKISEITNEIPLYSLTIEDGVTPKTDRYNREFLVKQSDKKYKIVEYNDIVYNPANLRFGAISLNKNKDKVLVSPIYEIVFISDNEKYDVNFISYILTSPRQIAIFSTKTQGTLVERMSVKIDTFLNTDIKVPSTFSEQNAIANILTTADKEISLLEEKLEILREQKKALMQNLLTGKVRVKV